MAVGGRQGEWSGAWIVLLRCVNNCRIRFDKFTNTVISPSAEAA